VTAGCVGGGGGGGRTGTRLGCRHGFGQEYGEGGVALEALAFAFFMLKNDPGILAV